MTTLTWIDGDGVTRFDLTPERYLPLFGRLAIEELRNNPELRNPTALERVLNAHTASCGCEPDSKTAASVLAICVVRFYGWDRAAYLAIEPTL